MTEQEWLICAEPGRMLAYLEARRLTSARKLRLWVVACREIAMPEKVRWGFDLSRSADLYHAVLDWSRDTGSDEDRLIPLAVRADLLRDLFGNPWKTYAWTDCHDCSPSGHELQFLDRRWLTWQDGTIPRMARHIDDASDFAALPVLADALEDAGCQEEAILRHCREPLHVRGCWCLDLLLGKS